jgi:hypothetical protein
MISKTGCVLVSLTQHGALERHHTGGKLQANGDAGHQARLRLILGDFGPAVALLLIGMVALPMATFSPSGKDGQYGVIAPPWYRIGDTISLIRKADGGIVEVGGSANVVIAHSESPDFARALYSAGAWLVVDPISLRGCGGFRQGAQ